MNLTNHPSTNGLVVNLFNLFTNVATKIPNIKQLDGQSTNMKNLKQNYFQ
jgi:hypothetical protein